MPALTPYENALAALLAPLSPVAAEEVLLSAALGKIAAGSGAATLPAVATARRDGWAGNSYDVIGASVMTPVTLMAELPWIEVGQNLPEGSDMILPPELAERRGPLFWVTGEALPGEGLWRPGEWVADAPLIAPGRQIGLGDIWLAQAAGQNKIACREVLVYLADLGADGIGLTSRLLRQWLAALGARVTIAKGFPPEFIAEAYDLVLSVGGTGRGKNDRAAEILAQQAELIAQGIGLSGAPTTILAQREGRAFLGLPGATEAAMVAALAVVLPVLNRLSGAAAAPAMARPLAGKISSEVGQAELVLLSEARGHWQPLAIGQPTPQQFRAAQAWAVIGSGDEGWPQGAPLHATALPGWG